MAFSWRIVKVVELENERYPGMSDVLVEQTMMMKDF